MTETLTQTQVIYFLMLCRTLGVMLSRLQLFFYVVKEL